MTTDDGYASPQERFVLRGIERWTMIVKAAGLLGDETEESFMQRPFKVRGLKPVHAHWIKVGKPRPPGERNHDPQAWDDFVVKAHQLRKKPT